ncbi:hypothetical protein G7Y89_g11758 [Cudoniella acicularis]|uniref:Dihydrodipicolinate synthetase n=1 Tax=Cudoniella acicularis TaxID=354080 RepID=A0A8H4RAC2_9HELO|nr:hypothetical protein G7Y89_g11758 [Cudoniella acicularis]
MAITNGSSNGSKSAGKPFPPGVHVPSLTWFLDTPEQEIDWEVQKKHLAFLIESGLHGSASPRLLALLFPTPNPKNPTNQLTSTSIVVLAGTNGEAVTLSATEKSQLVKTTRELAMSLGRPELTVILGCGGGSTQQVIAETKLAKEAGADYALVLVPSYFHFAMSEDAIVAFFQELATASPLPILIYNFPGVSSGLDVNSNMLETLGHHPNIVGVKLTCGGIAKVARIRSRFEPKEFCALAGQSDWMLPAIAVGGIGSITGLANIYPRACIELYDQAVAGKTKEAEKSQIELAAVEWGVREGRD